MIYYKNASSTVKTFYGVEFAPQEIKGVSGYINDSNMIRVEEPMKVSKSAETFVDIEKDKPKAKEQSKTTQTKSTPKEEK